MQDYPPQSRCWDELLMLMKTLVRWFGQQCFYKALGINPTADQKAIKVAYYQLAQKLHPDVNKSQFAEEEFLKVKNAYETLSDPVKKKLYDSNEPFKDGGGEAGKAKQKYRRRDYSEVYAEFDEYFKIKRDSERMQPTDIHVECKLTFEQSILGARKQLQFSRLVVCSRCKGHGNEESKKAPRCFSCGGRGRFGGAKAEEDCQHCEGTGLYIKNKCGECRGEGLIKSQVSLAVTSQRGTTNGGMLKKQGAGNQNRVGKHGDLLVTFSVGKSERFLREGYNIRTRHNLSLSQAVLGGVVEVQSVYGPVKVEVRAGTASGDQRRLANLGVQSPLSGLRGDQIVTFSVAVPTPVGAQLRELFQMLREEQLRRQTE